MSRRPEVSISTAATHFVYRHFMRLTDEVIEQFSQQDEDIRDHRRERPLPPIQGERTEREEESR